MTGRDEEGGDFSPRHVEGLVSLRSRFSAPETLERARSAITAKGVEVFACIDHAAAAERIELAMPAATVLVFGNPRTGTPLMLEAATFAIDLPLRMLIWEDGGGLTWVSYNEPRWLGWRHGVPDDGGPKLDAMAGLLAALANEAAGEGAI